MQAHRTLILERYHAAHGATPPVDYPHYWSVGPTDAPSAVLGYRSAQDGPLFLERYLGRPIEDLVTDQLGRPVARSRIVEMGDHASRRPAATVALWREAATSLAGQADVAVAVLTRSLRLMLEDIGLPLIKLAPARIEAVGADAANWGRYYEAGPIVCAGEVMTGLAALGRSRVR